MLATGCLATKRGERGEFPRGTAMPELIIYVVFCALTGIGGMDRRLGFFTTFFLALAFTPFLVLPFLLISGPSRNSKWRGRL
jgi:hypothetical protein